MSESLAEAGVADLLRRLERHETSAREITAALLDRIAALDGRLGAVLRVNPRALEEAHEQDARRARGEAGPLCGVPVAIKDNILTRGLETTCASRLLAGYEPLVDATAVARLRAAGAIVLCKTNLDEFGMGSSTENSAYHPTRNPWDPERVPGGSSGGSAAAVAARLAPAALGSDTGGSVRQPAAFCGIVGLKPTYGRVSRFGLVAFGSSLDQVGPMARSTGDCAALLEALAGPDPRDATASAAPTDPYTRAVDDPVEGLRVGLAADSLGEGVDPDVLAAVRGAADDLARQGARIETVTLPHAAFAIPAYYLVATAEASSNLARFDGVRYGCRVDPDGTLRGLYEATRGRGFGPEVKRRIMLGTYALSAGYHEAYYGRAMKVRTLLRRDFESIFAAGVQVVLTPTTPTPAFRLGEKTADPVSMYLSDVFTATVSLAGLPAVAVPRGLSRQGLPLGVQVIGPAFGEAVALRAAAAIERAAGTLGMPPGLSAEPA